MGPQEEEPEKYQSHFAKYVEEGVDPSDLEDLYKEVRIAVMGAGGGFNSIYSAVAAACPVRRLACIGMTGRALPVFLNSLDKVCSTSPCQPQPSCPRPSHMPVQCCLGKGASAWYLAVWWHGATHPV